MPTREYKTTTSSGIGVKIPLIDKPLFRSIYEWRQLQKPQKFANHIRVGKEMMKLFLKVFSIRRDKFVFNIILIWLSI